VGTDFDGAFKRNDANYSTDIWKFDQYSVDVQDNTTTVSNLIVESGQLNTKALNYYDFEAGDTGDRVAITHDTSGFTKISVSAWVMMESMADDYRGIVTCMDSDGWNEGFGLSFDNEGSGELSFWIDNAKIIAGERGPAVAIASLSTGQWYHLVGTYDGTYQRLYIDGVSQPHSGSNPSVSWDAKAASDKPIHIGAGMAADGTTAIYLFDGKIRDVRIWKDFALSDDQVVSLYRGSYNSTPTLGYKLDEASGNAIGWGTTATTGTVNGPTLTTTGTLKVNGAARVLTNGSVL